MRRRDNTSSRPTNDCNPNHNSNNNLSSNANSKHHNGHQDKMGGRNNGRDSSRMTSKSNVNSKNEKVPVSFKEFTNEMLEDDVTAQEAQKRYEKYLQRFSKSDDVLFFEAHKDEEWFQERYDPIIIEKSIEARRENARKHYWRFYEQFLNDDLPDVHDNVHDFQPLPNTIKTSSDDEEQKQDDQDMYATQKAGGDADAAQQAQPKQQDEEGSTEDAIPTTTTTTTIGTKEGEDEQMEGQREGDDDDMDIDQDQEDGDGDGDENSSSKHVHVCNKSNRIIPDDGKLRLPKYADFVYKDDYEPHIRESSPFEKRTSTRTSERSACYQNSIFIQGIPLHIQRDKILIPFQKYEGFQKLILSDPIRNSRKVRYGWVTFDNQEHCRLALKDVNSGGLNGHQLTGQYFMNLLPKQKSKRRPKFAPPESLYPHRVMYDIKQTYKLAKKFDEEAGIKNNPLLREELLSKLCEIRRLNLLLLYLRRIHFLCYYCGKHFLSEEHMFARCSGTHERKVPNDISLAMSGNIDIELINQDDDGNGSNHNHDSQGNDDENNTNPEGGTGSGGNGDGTKIVKKDKTSWEKDLDQRINDVLNYVIDHKRCWIDRKQIKMLEKNTKKVSEGKYRCTICSKLFKADLYVIKHIKNKHQDEIAKYIADQRLRTMFENYRRDRDRLTIRSFEDNDNNEQSNKNKSGSSSAHSSKNTGNNNMMMMGNNGGHGMNAYAQPLANQLYVAAASNVARHAHPVAIPLGAAAPHLMIPAAYAHHAHALASGYPAPFAAASALQQPAAPAQPPNTAGTAAAANKGGASEGNNGMHPERAALTGSLSGPPPDRRGGARSTREDHRPSHRHPNHRRGDDLDLLQDAYGRKIPIHYQDAATRTRRSYKEVDIEFPDQEDEEEIDYGFGDFVKSDTKFNL